MWNIPTTIDCIFKNPLFFNMNMAPKYISSILICIWKFTWTFLLVFPWDADIGSHFVWKTPGEDQLKFSRYNDKFVHIVFWGNEQGLQWENFKMTISIVFYVVKSMAHDYVIMKLHLKSIPVKFPLKKKIFPSYRSDNLVQGQTGKHLLINSQYCNAHLNETPKGVDISISQRDGHYPT